MADPVVARIGLRWLPSGFFVFGIACLVWACVAWTHAAFFQVRATREIAKWTAVPALPGAPVLNRPDSSVIGLLDIPRLDFSVAVLQGDDDRALAIAVGHLPDTPMPWDAGNSALAGHRDTFFRPLENLRAGDLLRFSTSRGDFRYRVRRLLIVEPDDVWVLNPASDVSLTLITCYPFKYVGSAPQRFVVQAERLVNEVASELATVVHAGVVTATRDALNPSLSGGVEEP